MSDQVYSTGRRKESIAKVWVSNGSGNIIINKKKIEDYFPDKALRMIINQPLEVSKKMHSIGRIGSPEIVAKFATPLILDSSSWITGSIINIDGGLSTTKLVS